MSQPNEASVEEILESIKKVIARDSRENALEMRRQRESDGIVRNVEIDEEVDAAEEDEEVLDLGEMEFAEDVNADEAPDHDPDSPLTSEDVRDSMRENFSALAMLG